MVMLQSVSSLFLTKLYLQYLGYHTYGVYQMVFSVAQYVLLLDFGIATAVMRFRIECTEKKDRKADENLLAHCAAIVGIVSVLVIVIGGILIKLLPNIYVKLNAQDARLAQTLLFFMIGQIVFTLGEHYFQGIALSEEKYTFVKLIPFLRLLGKIALITVLIIAGFGVLTIAIVDFVLSAISFVVFLWYCVKNIDFKIKLHFLDKFLLKNIAVLMGALALQSLACYINNFADKTILGIMMDAQAVTVYSLAVTINSFFASVPQTINSVYVPRATQLVMRNASSEELTDLVIRPGRIQFMFCGAVIAGFALFGKDFISLWIGDEGSAAWLLSLILIVPNLFPLVQNVCLSILTAMNKRLFRSLTVVATSILNIIITIVLVRKVGILGAAIGTAISLLLGTVIITNIYYHKAIGLNVFRMYKEIFERTFVCILIATAVSLLFMLVPLPFALLWRFLTRCLVFCLVYAAALWFYGVNEYEKQLVVSIVSKFAARRK